MLFFLYFFGLAETFVVIFCSVLFYYHCPPPEQSVVNVVTHFLQTPSDLQMALSDSVLSGGRGKSHVNSSLGWTAIQCPPSSWLVDVVLLDLLPHRVCVSTRTIPHQ